MSESKKLHQVGAVAGYGPALGRLIWALEDTRRRTGEALAGISSAALDWTDAASPNSIGALLYHVAAIEADWVFSDILGVEIPTELMALFPVDVREENGRLSPMHGELDEHLARLAHVRNAVLEALTGLADENLDQPRDMGSYQVTPAWVLHHLMQHEAEHRGQIGALREQATSK